MSFIWILPKRIDSTVSQYCGTLQSQRSFNSRITSHILNLDLRFTRVFIHKSQLKVAQFQQMCWLCAWKSTLATTNDHMVMRNIKLQQIRYKPFLRRRWIRPTGNCKPARIDLLLLVLFPPVADFPRPDILQDFLQVLSSEFIQIVSVWRSIWIAHVLGFRDKPANFSRLHCLAIPRRDLSTKKTKPNIEKWPESLGVMLEF